MKKNLINLGVAPDSGTGDSARRGGEKINTLFTDIYANFGDAPVGNDPSGSNYGYKQPINEFDYQVGELMPAGRYVPVGFSVPASNPAVFDTTYGWGVDNSGNLVDTDGDGVPDIYQDTQWYFLSRGECITLDLTSIGAGNDVHVVLPLAVPGDVIKVRDSFKTWGSKYINVWTTPYEFADLDQMNAWTSQSPDNLAPDSDSVSVYQFHDSETYRVNYRKVDSTFGVNLDLGVPSTNGNSPVRLFNYEMYEIEFVYMGYRTGWGMRRTLLNSYDLNAEVKYLKETHRGNFLSAKTINPAARDDNSALQEGDLYFNTVNDLFYFWTGTQWNSVLESLDIIARLDSDSAVVQGLQTQLNKETDIVDLGTSNTLTIVADNGHYFYGTMSGVTQIVIDSTGLDASKCKTIKVELTGSGSAIVWPATVKWQGGTTPARPGSTEIDLYELTSRDAGATWLGTRVVDNAG